MSELLPADTRIMHVLTDTNSVLAEVARHAIQAQLDAGYRVAVASRESVFKALNVAGDRLRHIEIGAGAGLRLDDPNTALTLHKYYRHIDLVHAHGLHAAALAGAGLTGLPQSMHPTIVASVGRDGSMLADAQAQIVAKTATVVLGTTEPIVEKYVDTVAIVERAQLLSSDVDPVAQPRLSREEARDLLDVPSGAWLVSSPVALIDSPAVTTIAEVGVRLATYRSDRSWVFALTGGGRSRSTVRSGIVDRVEHMRLAEEVSTVDVLSASDVVVASDRMTAVDAERLMQLGRPVVFVGSEQNGRMYGDGVPQFAPDDVDGALHAVAELIDRPALRVQNGIHAHDRVSTARHTFIADHLLSVYAQALVLNDD